MRNGIDAAYYITEQIIEKKIKDRVDDCRNLGKRVDLHYHSIKVEECNDQCVSEEQYQAAKELSGQSI